MAAATTVRYAQAREHAHSLLGRLAFGDEPAASLLDDARRAIRIEQQERRRVRFMRRQRRRAGDKE